MDPNQNTVTHPVEQLKVDRYSDEDLPIDPERKHPKDPTSPVPYNDIVSVAGQWADEKQGIP